MNFKIENIDGNLTDPRWLTKPRMDLCIIPKMFNLGFDVEMDYNDKRYGRTTPDNCPMERVTFQKDNYRIWGSIKRTDDGIFNYWITAFLVDGHYVLHTSFDEIDETIDHYNNNYKQFSKHV